MDICELVVDIDSPDTDVFLFCSTLKATLDENRATIRFLKKQPAKKKGDLININTVVQVLGKNKALGLVGIHSYTRSDWGGKFAGITKKGWISKYLDLDATSQAVNAFINLGEDIDPQSLQSALEKFTCTTYAKNTACNTVSELRWELFRDCRKEGEGLPPTSDTLIPHIRRAHVIAQIAKGFRQPHPNILPLKGNGWEESSTEGFVAIMCLSPPAPQAVLALTKCSCKKSACSPTSKCSCASSVPPLPCTGLCKCGECDNKSAVYQNSADIDECDDESCDED